MTERCSATAPGLTCALTPNHPGDHHDWNKIQDWTTNRNEDH